ncbi:MAG: hypothetical protein H6667_02620 [Ardenticatenaceae bacterium]|nr:hypothetical protein [Ardenticatenaceae bacterium]
MKLAQLRYARLDREKMAMLHELEGKIGKWVIAVEPATSMTEITDEQLLKLKALEEELGVILLAYKMS